MPPLRLFLLLLLGAVLLSACNSGSGRPGFFRIRAGAVYVPTNEDSNRVVAFARHPDGTMSRIDTYGTGGRGTAGKIVPLQNRVVVDPLFSSDSAVLSPNRQLLLVVNAGDGSITSFRVNADFSLARADREATDGALPNSVAVNADGLVYVSNVNNPRNMLNPNGDRRATLVGFRADAQGGLTPIPGSLRTLEDDASHPSQVLFDPSGKWLLVVELFVNTISVYGVAADGTLVAPVRNTLTVGAFAGEFTGADVLVTADVSPPQTPGSGSASSFRLAAGTLTPITAGVRNGKEAPCWTAITPNGRFLYTSDTETGTVQHYGLDDSGMLTLVDANAASKPALGGVSANNTPTSGPVDTFVTSDGQFLYQQFSGRGSVVGYRIGSDGRLSEIGEFGRDLLPLVGAEGVVGF